MQHVKRMFRLSLAMAIVFVYVPGDAAARVITIPTTEVVVTDPQFLKLKGTEEAVVSFTDLGGRVATARADWQILSPVVISLPEIALDFDNEVPTVSVPAFTVVIEPIDAIAIVPVALLRNFVITASVTFPVINYASDTLTYEIEEDGLVKIPLPPPINLSSTVSYDSPAGSVTRDGGQDVRLSIALLARGVPGAPIELRDFRMARGGPVIPNLVDPVSGEEISLSLSGPGLIPNLGPIAVVAGPPRCGLGYELALILPGLMWLHRRRRRLH